MPEQVAKSDAWADSTALSVSISTRRRYNSRELTAHVCSDGKACSDYSMGSESIVMPAREFVNWDKACKKCRQAVAQMLEPNDEYGTLKEELYSPTGRPACQILIDEGLVPAAVEAFRSQHAMVVAGLAQASLGEVLEILHGEKSSWTKYNIRCPNCLEEVSSNSLGRWPYVKRFQLDCQKCPATTDINLYEYYPGHDWALEMLDEQNLRSRGTSSYNLVWHDIDLTDAIADKEEDEKFAEREVHINATSRQTTVHDVEDGEIQCGVNAAGDSITVYSAGEESFSFNHCGNCQ